MKEYYEGFLISNKLSDAMNQFEKDHPNRHLETEAFEQLLEKYGYYSKTEDKEVE